MTELIDRYLVEVEDGRKLEFKTAKEANVAQKQLHLEGYMSQTYHEHLVLMKTPCGWASGDRRAREKRLSLLPQS